MKLNNFSLLANLYKPDIFKDTDSITIIKSGFNDLKNTALSLVNTGSRNLNLNATATIEGSNYNLTLRYSSLGPFKFSLTDNTGADVTGHSNNHVTHQHIALDELIPLSIHNILLSSSSDHVNEIISELKKNNLADKVLNVYYRIKRNVEYISRGKESLYSVTPNYPQTSNFFINSRDSRHYFYLIAHDPTHSFGLVVNLAAHLLQNNKLRLEQNTKGLQGYRLL